MGGRWQAMGTVYIHDASHNPVLETLVHGLWGDPDGTEASCTTDVNGRCTMTSDLIRNNFGSVTFDITSIVDSTFPYSPAANHDPDGDSDGTNLLVLKP
jgi:hypothetical protein